MRMHNLLPGLDKILHEQWAWNTINLTKSGTSNYIQYSCSPALQKNNHQGLSVLLYTMCVIEVTTFLYYTTKNKSKRWAAKKYTLFYTY